MNIILHAEIFFINSTKMSTTIYNSTKSIFKINFINHKRHGILCHVMDINHSFVLTTWKSKGIRNMTNYLLSNQLKTMRKISHLWLMVCKWSGGSLWKCYNPVGCIAYFFECKTLANLKRTLLLKYSSLFQARRKSMWCPRKIWI